MNSEPLFRHPRLIAAAMLTALAVAVGGALYVRPLSGDAPQAQNKSSAVALILGVHR
jgi:uncharacterized UPF0146 family protein